MGAAGEVHSATPDILAGFLGEPGDREWIQRDGKKGHGGKKEGRKRRRGGRKGKGREVKGREGVNDEVPYRHFLFPISNLAVFK